MAWPIAPRVLTALRALMLGVALSPVGVTTTAAAAETTTPAGPPSPPSGQVVTIPDRVVVVFDRGVDGADRADTRNDTDTELVRTLGSPRFQLLDPDPGQSVSSAVHELNADADVTVATPDYAYPVAAAPNDPLFDQLWGLDNTGSFVNNATTATAGDDISALEAWNTTIGSPSTVVADIDSGYRFDHPDLEDQAWTNEAEANGQPGVDDDGNGLVDDVHGYDWIGDDFDHRTADADPTDADTVNGGHGVHTAGIIGAAGNNGIGITGISQQVTIMPLKICAWSATFVGTFCPTDAIVAGMNYAGDKGARAANLSIGGRSSGGALVELEAMAAHPNTLYVISAGNDAINNDTNAQPTFPCSFDPSTSATPGAIDNVVCVAATDQSDNLASFSSYGPNRVDIAAPGTDILSTLPVFNSDWDTFEHEDFDSRWHASGGFLPFGRAGRSDSAAMTSRTMTDTPGGPAAPNATYEMTSASFHIDPGLGDCLIQGTRNWLRQPANDSFAYTAILNGVPLPSQNPTTTGRLDFSGALGNGLVAGGDVQFAFHYQTGATVSATAGVWLDNLRLTCRAPAVGRANGYGFLNGTSMAAPEVTGTAALLFSRKPSAGVTEVKNAIIDSADPVASLATKVGSGGRLDAAAALDELDLTDPVSQASAPAATHSTPISVDYTVSDVGKGVDKVQLYAKAPGDSGYSLADTDDSPSASGSFSYAAGAGDGDYSFYTRAIDKTGNTEDAPSAADATTVLDTVTPTSTTSPPTYSTANTIAVGWTGDGTGTDLDRVELYVKRPGDTDYAVALTDSSPGTSGSFAYTAAAGDGDYSFFTRARDAAGNLEDLGTTGPVTSLDTQKPTSSANAPAAFNGVSLDVPYTAGDNIGVTKVELWIKKPGESTYTLSGSLASGATSGDFFVTTVPEGSYRFYTLAYDAAGNAEDVPSDADSVTIVDHTAPTAGLTAPAATKSSPIDLDYTADGTGSDLAEVQLWVKAPGDSSYALAHTDSSPGTTGSFSYTPAAGDGGYDFYAIAVDKAGNERAIPTDADATVTFDTADPTASASSPTYAKSAFPVSYTADGTGSALDKVELWVKAPGDSAYSLADTDSSPGGTGSFSYAPLAGDGDYDFYAIAVDEAGNEQAVPTDSDTQTLFDSAAPAASASAPALAASSPFAVGYTASDTGGSGLDKVELWVKRPGDASYSLAGTDSAPGATGSFDYAATAGDGTYAFFAVVSDKAGNANTVAASHDTLVDRALPTASLSAPDLIAAGPVHIDYSADGTGSSLDKVELWVKRPGDSSYSLAGTDSAPGTTGSFTYAVSHGDGEYAFYAIAVDKAGNSRAVPASRDAATVLDSTVPTAAASAAAYSKSATIAVGYVADGTGSALDKVELWVKRPGDSSYSLALTDSSPGATGSFSYTAAAGDGEYAFYAIAVDKAGHSRAVPASRDGATVLDRSLPTASASAPALTGTSPVTVSYTAGDTGSGLGRVELWVKRPGDAAYSLGLTDSSPGATGSFSYSAAHGDGDYAFYAVAVDKAGNARVVPSQRDATTTVDRAAPASSASSPATVAVASFAVGYSADGTGSALTKVELWAKGPSDAAYSLVTTDGAPASPGAFAYNASQGDGDYAFYTLAYDAAGNAEAVPSARDATTTVTTRSPSGPSGPAEPALKAGACQNPQIGIGSALRLVGSAAGDRLVGSDGNDVLDGGLGDDCLEGRGGNDRLIGGGGADRMRGGDGTDVLDGGDGKDRYMRGEGGNDRMTGGAGDDGLFGGAGDDALSGGAGDDYLSGGEGNDRLTGGSGDNSYFGRSGNDSINAANGVRETVDCGSGGDRATVDKNDRVTGCEHVTRK